MIIAWIGILLFGVLFTGGLLWMVYKDTPYTRDEEDGEL